MGQPTDQQVEESRRQLRAILSRRDFVTAAGVGMLGLAGCSSEPPTTGTVTPPPPSSGTIPSGLEPVSGSVSLPAGSTLKLTDLSVDVMTQAAPVSASAAFTVGISSDGPALALLLDKNGNGVLMAMFDASLPNQAISPRSTAIALLYYATNAYLYPASYMSQILALISADPAVAAVAAAIATSVAADPQALANNAAPIGPAVVQAMQAIMGESVKATAAKLPAARLSQAPPTLITLNSVSEQNGILVSLDTDAIAALLSNVKRRPCHVWVYEVGTKVTGQDELPVIPAKYVAGPIPIDPTESLTLLNALSDVFTFFNGSSPWSPVNLAPIPLPLDKDVTRYNVVVIAAASKSFSYDTWEPAFFRDAHYVDSARPIWQADAQALLREVFFVDILLPALCYILGYGPISKTRATVAAIVADAAGVVKLTMDTLVAGLRYSTLGDFQEGLVDLVQNAYTSQLQTGTYTGLVKQVMDPIKAEAIAASQARGVDAARMVAGRNMFLKIFGPIYLTGAILQGVDFCAMLSDIWNSDIASFWEIVVARQLLGLVPSPPAPVNAGTRVRFSVSAPVNAPPGTYQYVWTQSSSPFAFLSAVGEANVGPTTITTTQLSVDLATSGSDVLPINVLVIGYDLHGVEIGRAGTTVNFLAPCQILPSNAAMAPGDQRTFSVVVGGLGTAPPPKITSYRWTLTGTSGSIGSSVVTTPDPNINYTAITPGNDSLHVDVLFGSTVVAMTDAPITVFDKASIKFTLSGTWDPTRQPANGTYAFNTGSSLRAPGMTGDGLLFNYDAVTLLGTPDPSGMIPGDSYGVTLTLIVGHGGIPKTGDSFAKIAGMPTVVPGHFQFGLSQDLNNVSGTIQTGPTGTGTCNMDGVSQLPDGSLVVQYSFTINGSSGGLITGSGVARLPPG